MKRRRVLKLLLLFLPILCVVLFAYDWREPITIQLIQSKNKRHPSKPLLEEVFGNQRVIEDEATSGNLGTEDSKKGTATVEPLFALDDVFITVKTSYRFHGTRVIYILQTWWNFASNQTYFFTDSDDERLTHLTGGHIINTNCGKDHSWGHLCCKMGYEYDAYYISGKKWWCHFDDDNYVNVDALVKLLRFYDWKSDWYIGRPSRPHPISARYFRKLEYFWFLTGGAGVCISRSLARKMSHWSRNGLFQQTCYYLNEPDDTTIGFIINNRLRVELTTREEFISHLHELNKIPSEKLPFQVSISYRGKENVVRHSNVSRVFSENEDPSRFLTHHCLLHPELQWCSEHGRKPDIPML